MAGGLEATWNVLGDTWGDAKGDACPVGTGTGTARCAEGGTGAITLGLSEQAPAGKEALSRRRATIATDVEGPEDCDLFAAPCPLSVLAR
jgi:hypothetical protein